MRHNKEATFCRAKHFFLQVQTFFVCTPHRNKQLKLNINCHNLCGNLNDIKNQYALVLTRKIVMQREHLACLLEWHWTHTKCCLGEEGWSLRNLCTQRGVYYTPFTSLSDPSSLLYVPKKKLLLWWFVCEFAGSQCTSWSTETEFSFTRIQTAYG